MYYIGYDIGSSSIKAALVTVKNGKCIALVQEPKVEMEILALKNGWAEQDPERWWKNVCAATQSLIQKTGIASNTIMGIGIAYQMHGLVLVDKAGNSLRNSIIWCDSRAVTIGERAYQELGEENCKTTLLNSPANFTASKLKWVKENEPELFQKIYKFMLPGDYIAYKLSGVINTTLSGLSEGILWNFKTDSIANELLQHYGIHQTMIPDIVPTFGVQGEVSDAASKITGLPSGIPILYRAGDQPNNALCLNVFKPGELAATGGTSGVIYAVTDKLSVKESSRVNNFAHVNYTNSLARIGKLLCINGSGIQYRWLLNNLKVDSYQEMNSLAQEVPVGADGVQILPFGNGAERMLDNKTVGTHLLNLNLNRHGKAHLCRAALEGIAFAFVYGMEILKSDGITTNVIRVGNDNLFQSPIFSNTIATLIQQEIEVYDTTGAIGAARASGLHKGDFEAYGKLVLENDYLKSFKPDSDSTPYQLAYNNWKKELIHLLKPH